MKGLCNLHSNQHAYWLSTRNSVETCEGSLSTGLFDRCELTPMWVKGPGVTSYTGSPTKRVSFSMHSCFGLYSYLLCVLVENSINYLYWYDI